MNLSDYRAWKTRGYPGLQVLQPAAREQVTEIMDEVYGLRPKTKAIDIKRKPYNGPVYTMPMGTVSTASSGRSSAAAFAARWRAMSPAEKVGFKFKLAMESAVTKALQKLGYLCAHCGNGLQDADAARLCGGCANAEIGE